MFSRGKYSLPVRLILTVILIIGLLIVYEGFLTDNWSVRAGDNLDVDPQHSKRKLLFESKTGEPPSIETLIDSILIKKNHRDQRNEFSKLLNLHKQMIGRLQCELRGHVDELNFLVARSADFSGGANFTRLKRVADQPEQTSETGGWCPKATKEKHYTDMSLVRAFSEFFKGKYVGSFGDGPGMYKKHLLADGKVQGFDSYDGAPFCEQTSDGRVQFLDLTLPQYGLPLYDWILTLEVAEHIPEQFEKVFIDNVVRHAKEGVVISWAVPGQLGYSHVNMREFSYVKNLMESLGFAHDDEASIKIRSSATGPNLKRNINVFRRKDVSNDVVKELLYEA